MAVPLLGGALLRLLLGLLTDHIGARRVGILGMALRRRDTWWFCLFYSITFGGFVGLASFLNIAFALVGGFGGAAALACANREWQGIFIGHRGIALDRG